MGHLLGDVLLCVFHRRFRDNHRVRVEAEAAPSRRRAAVDPNDLIVPAAPGIVLGIGRKIFQIGLVCPHKEIPGLAGVRIELHHIVLRRVDGNGDRIAQLCSVFLRPFGGDQADLCSVLGFLRSVIPPLQKLILPDTEGGQTLHTVRRQKLHRMVVPICGFDQFPPGLSCFALQKVFHAAAVFDGHGYITFLDRPNHLLLRGDDAVLELILALAEEVEKAQ